MATNLIDNNLKIAVDTSQPVTMKLRDGNVVSLRVKEFDGYVALIEGDPDYLLYRHSILEIDAGPARGPRRSAERPANKGAGKPRPSSARPKQPRKPSKAPAAGRPPQPRQDQKKPGEPGFGNSLADKLKAWQDSQKEGE